MIVPAANELTVDATFVNAQGDIDIYLWDPSFSCDSAALGQGIGGAPLTLGFTSSDDESLTYTNATGATQSLIVEVRIFEPTAGPVVGCNDYDLSFAVTQSSSPCATPDVFEQNDQCTAAQELLGGTVTGLNISDSDPDFYAVALADWDTMDITASFVHADGDLDIYLWDPLLACDSSIVGQGSAGMPLTNGFTTTDDEALTYTNTTGATLHLILEVSAFGAVQCTTYDLTVNGAIGDPPPLGWPFCAANDNSTGLPSEISATGSASVAQNNVTLHVANLPPSQFGIFVVSRTAGAMSPVNEGVLCLSGDIGRYQQPSQVFQSDATGSASMMIDLQSIPLPTGIVPIGPGGTLYFQAWHRDFVNGDPAQGNTSNFTNGVRILFVD